MKIPGLGHWVEHNQYDRNSRASRATGDHVGQIACPLSRSRLLVAWTWPPTTATARCRRTRPDVRPSAGLDYPIYLCLVGLAQPGGSPRAVAFLPRINETRRRARERGWSWREGFHRIRFTRRDSRGVQDHVGSGVGRLVFPTSANWHHKDHNDSGRNPNNDRCFPRGVEHHSTDYNISTAQDQKSCNARVSGCVSYLMTTSASCACAHGSHFSRVAGISRHLHWTNDAD